jgi:hypothetical protein
MESIKAKSVIISRKPNKDKEGIWSVLVALFDENNPHLKGREASRVLEYKEVEKVRVKELRNISFYLMGSDLVINNLVKIDIDEKKGIVTLTGKQRLP